MPVWNILAVHGFSKQVGLGRVKFMGLLLKLALKGLQMVFIVVCYLIIYIIYALKCSVRSLMALYEVF